jgi:hypothetical protein
MPLTVRSTFCRLRCTACRSRDGRRCVQSMILCLTLLWSWRQVPAERWDIEAAYSPDVANDKMYVRHAGFLRAVDAFDADAFRYVHPEHRRSSGA